MCLLRDRTPSLTKRAFPCFDASMLGYASLLHDSLVFNTSHFFVEKRTYSFLCVFNMDWRVRWNTFSQPGALMAAMAAMGSWLLWKACPRGMTLWRDAFQEYFRKRTPYSTKTQNWETQLSIGLTQKTWQLRSSNMTGLLLSPELRQGLSHEYRSESWLCLWMEQYGTTQRFDMPDQSRLGMRVCSTRKVDPPRSDLL